MDQIEDKRTAILDATLRLISKNGFHGTAMSKVAKEAGVSAGIIYHYFDSKDDLFMECMITVFEKIQEFSMDAVNEDASLEEVLEAMFSFDDIYKALAESLNIDFHSSYLDYSYLMFVGIKKFPRIREMSSAMYREMQQGLELMFNDWQAKGVIKKEINCKILAFELIAVVEGAMMVSGLSAGIDLTEVGKDLLRSTLERISV